MHSYIALRKDYPVGILLASHTRIIKGMFVVYSPQCASMVFRL